MINIKRPLFWVKLAHWQHIVIVVALAFPIMSGLLVLNHKIKVAKGDQQKLAVDSTNPRPSPTPTMAPGPAAQPTSTPEVSGSSQPTPTVTPSAKKTSSTTPADTNSSEPVPSGPETSAPVVSESPTQTKKTYPKVATKLWGVTLNLFPDYNENLTTARSSIDQAIGLGVDIIRLDYPANRFDLEEIYQPAVGYAKSKGLKVVMSFQPPKTYDTPNPWQAGYDLGKKVAQQYGGTVIYQAGNEVAAANDAIKPGWPGNNQESYHLDKLNQVRAWVKGAVAAITKYAPGAKIGISINWLTYWGADFIINQDGGEPNIQFIGLNWFNDQQDLTRIKSGGEIINLVEKLQEVANGRELWIMESGRLQGGFGVAGEQAQAEQVESFAKHVVSTQAFTVHLYFILYDDANKVGENPEDASRGLIRVENTSGVIWTIGGLKPAYERYKKIIEQYK